MKNGWHGTGAIPLGEGVGRELLPLLMVFFLVGGVTFSYLQREGILPSFYQFSLGPAVLAACGHPLGNLEGVPALTRFLELQGNSGTFDCADLPAQPDLLPLNNFQLSHWLPLVVLGGIWRMTGVTWALNPLLGAILFALFGVGVYGVLRLGMGRPLAGMGAVVATVNPTLITLSPFFRDVSKAPFILAGIWCAGVVVGASRLSTRRLLLLMGVTGLLLGMGISFRRDVMVVIPLLAGALLFFSPPGRSVRVRVAGTLLLLAGVWLPSLPVQDSLNRGGGAADPLIQGWGDRFSANLGVSTTPYTFSPFYSDSYTMHQVKELAARRHGMGKIEFQTPEYLRYSQEYLHALWRDYPADLLTRAVASLVRVPELIPWHLGQAAILAALLLLLAQHWRIGWFALLGVGYLFTYPVIQFDPRHYFPLVAVPFLAGGWLVQQGLARTVSHPRRILAVGRWPRLVKALDPGPPRDPGALAVGLGRAMAVGLVLLLVGWLVLGGVREYQQRHLREVYQGLLNLPGEGVQWSMEPGTRQGGNGAGEERDDSGQRRLVPIPATPPVVSFFLQGEPAGADYYHLRFDPAGCGRDELVVVARHQPIPYKVDQNRTVSLTLDATRAIPLSLREGPVDLLIPLFSSSLIRFAGLEMPADGVGCLVASRRLRPDGKVSALPRLLLPPGWRDRPLYQELRWR